MFHKPLAIDVDAASEFVSKLYGAGATICCQVFAEARGCSIQPEWRYGKFKELVPWLVKSNQAGAGVYFMVNAGDGKGRRAENITQVTYLFVDLDGAPHEPLLKTGCPPHVITQSSPGRYQAFWKVSDCQPDQFAAYQKALATKFNADPAVCDLPRVMRLPGFAHQKSTPFQSEVIRYHDLQPWKPALMQKLLSLDLNGSLPKCNTVQLSDNEQFPEGQRHRSLATVVGRLRNSGLSGSDLLDTAMRVNNARCNPPLPEDEVRKLVNWGNKITENPIVPVSVDLMQEMDHPPVQDAFSLYHEPFEPIHWVVQDVLPVGLTVLAADPKSGKSYLSQHIAICVASGQRAMNRFDVSQGDVLCLSLEDSKSRFKQRLHRLLEDNPPPKRCFFARKWGQLPECAKQIRAWIKQADNPQLIVVDTFAKVRGRPRRWDSSGIYEKDYQDVSILQELAQDFRLALVLVHHTNKGDTDDDFRRISGTQGLTGAADAMWLMQTDREKMECTLVMAGREIPDKRYWLRMDPDSGIWKCMGTAADLKRNEAETRIIEALEENEIPMSLTDIGRYLGLSRQAITKQIRGLLEAGFIEKSVTGKLMLSPSFKNGYPRNQDAT